MSSRNKILRKNLKFIFSITVFYQADAKKVFKASIQIYLQDSFRQPGFKHLNTLSFWSGIMVAKLQKGQDSKSGMSAILISSSCIFFNTMEKTLVGSTCCRVASENFSKQDPFRHLKSVFPWPITTSDDLRMQVLQNRWPSGQAAMSSKRHSSSKQHWHSISSPLSLASWRRSS